MSINPSEMSYNEAVETLYKEIKNNNNLVAKETTDLIYLFREKLQENVPTADVGKFTEKVWSELLDINVKINKVNKSLTKKHELLYPSQLKEYLDQAEELATNFFKTRKDLAHDAMLEAKKELNKIAAKKNASSPTASPVASPSVSTHHSRSSSAEPGAAPATLHFEEYDDSWEYIEHVPKLFPGVTLDEASEKIVIKAFGYLYQIEKNRQVSLHTKNDSFTKKETDLIELVEGQQSFQRGKFIDEIQGVIDRYYPLKKKNREIINHIHETVKFLQMSWGWNQ